MAPVLNNNTQYWFQSYKPTNTPLHEDKQQQPTQPSHFQMHLLPIVLYLLGRLSLHLVAEVHVLEVLDLPGQSSGQQDALGLVLGVVAVLHLQFSG